MSECVSLLILMASVIVCIVCREAMEEGRRMPCGHILHSRCLLRWLERSQAPLTLTLTLSKSTLNKGIITNITVEILRNITLFSLDR